MAARTVYTAPVWRTTWWTAPSRRRMSTTSPWRRVRPSCRSRACFITCWYSRRSAWARRDHTAGPFPRLSIRYWMQARSAAFAISPPRASSSRTRWPLPVPPMAGLQGMLPTASRLMVKQMVRIPRRAAARAASMPAWPAPMTAISYVPAGNSLIAYLLFLPNNCHSIRWHMGPAGPTPGGGEFRPRARYFFHVEKVPKKTPGTPRPPYFCLTQSLSDLEHLRTELGFYHLIYSLVVNDASASGPVKGGTCF